jgi:transposase
MVNLELYSSIKALHAQGHNVKQIADRLSLTRNTVRKYLKSNTPPTRRPRIPEPNSLLPFEADITDMLERHLSGQHILEKLRARNYGAPLRTYYRHLKRLKRQIVPRLGCARFETLPGQQAQFDWATYTVQLGATVTRVYIFSLILGFSRYQHCYASLDCTQLSIFEALEDSFRFFSGVPREILFDNPKALVNHPRPNLRWNRSLLELAAHYGFQPVACWPARAQTKGKVERPFALVEEYFIKEYRFTSFSDLLAQLPRFETDRINGRLHGTTGETPVERFRREQTRLLPRPERHFIGTAQLWRKVSGDGLVSHNLRRYSVPWQFAYKSVWIRVPHGSLLEVYAESGERIATHEIKPEAGPVQLQEEHYTGLQLESSGYKTMLVNRFRQRFPQQPTFLDRLLGQYRFDATRHLRQLLELASEYPPEAMERAFAKAVEYNTFSRQFIVGILHAADETTEAACTASGVRTVVPSGLPAVDIRRDLRGYQALIPFPGKDMEQS